MLPSPVRICSRKQDSALNLSGTPYLRRVIQKEKKTRRTSGFEHFFFFVESYCTNMPIANVVSTYSVRSPYCARRGVQKLGTALWIRYRTRAQPYRFGPNCGGVVLPCIGAQFR